ncbi:hypothetical protein CDL15_Pgr029132 [Punica granatum]|uniref:Uncharacterized protein n=1 Tax=Punica granatum TaxID=22663 RepID=A0A218XM05_PUNGR|nr:hypothetical protein CDL15_Pgr029132 [Punica granatum]
MKRVPFISSSESLFISGSALWLLLIAMLLTREASSASTSTLGSFNSKLSGFQAELRWKLTAAIPLQLQTPPPGTSPPSVPVRVEFKVGGDGGGDGRVFYPKEYGADPTGNRESSKALQSAIGDAFRVQSQVQMLAGLKDLGGVVIDLQGGNYLISTPLTFPPSGGANLLMQSGTLRASETFPSDRHLIELRSPNSTTPSGISYEDITFEDILFDSSYRGGGISVLNSARIRISSCFFLHFETEGIVVQGGHETLVSGSFLGQHSTVGGDPGERGFSGTGIDLASNDNIITDSVIFSAATGIILRGQANIVTGVHCYNKATNFGGVGILVKLPGSSQTRIDNCYLDYTGIVMEDPVQVHVTNGFFLGDANVVLRPVKGRISGLNIVNNMFSGNLRKMIPIIELDGPFTNIDHVVVNRNNVAGMALKSTAGKLTVAGTNSTRWVADFSSQLIFPNKISHFQYSFYTKLPSKFPVHAVTNISNNVVVIESASPASALVSVEVDQHNMIAE